jgi:hypothetical protein
MAKKHRANEKRANLLWQEHKILLRRAEKAERESELAGLAKRGDARERRRAFTPDETITEIRDRVNAELDATPIQDIKPNADLAAAGRESRKSSRKVRAGKWLEAAEAKSHELENLERARIGSKLVKQAVKDRVQILKVRAYFGKNAAGTRVHEESEVLLERYEFKAATKQAQAKRIERTEDALAKWVEEQADLGFPIDAQDWVVLGNEKINHRELSPDRLHDVRTLLEALRHQAININKLSAESKKASRSDTADAITAQVISAGNIFGTPPKERALGEGDDDSKRAAGLKGFFAEQFKASVLARIMDGDADGGVVVSSIINPLNAVTTKSEIDQREAVQAQLDIYDEHFTTEEIARMEVERSFEGLSLSHEERLSVLGLMGSPEGRNRLNKWMTPVQSQAVLRSFTKADLAFVNDRWKLYDGRFNLIVESQQRLTGQTPKAVQPVNFTVVVDGERVQMTGGYHPLGYGDQDIQSQEQDALALKRGSRPSQQLNVGFLKPRKQEVPKDFKPDLSRTLVIRNTENVAHVLAVREAVSDVQSLLYDEKVSATIRAVHGVARLKVLRNWLQDVASDGSRAGGYVERTIGPMRSNSVAGVLGFRVKTSLMQFFGLKQTAVRLGGGNVAVGAKWVALATKQWFADQASTYGAEFWTDTKSDFMKERGRGNIDREFNNAAKNPLKNKTLETVREAAFYMILKAQRVVDQISFTAQYNKTWSERPDGMDPAEWELEAIARSEQMVRDSQHGGGVIDLSTVERGGPLMRLLTMFYTDSVLKFNQTALSASRTQWKSTRSIAEFLSDFTVLYFTEIAAIAILKSAVGLEDDEDDPATLQRMAASMVESVVILREGSGAIQNFQYRGPITLNAVASGFDALGDVLAGDADKSTASAAGRALGLFGVPVNAMKDAKGAISQVLNGEVPLSLVGVRPDR